MNDWIYKVIQPSLSLSLRNSSVDFVCPISFSPNFIAHSLPSFLPFRIFFFLIFNWSIRSWFRVRVSLSLGEWDSNRWSTALWLGERWFWQSTRNSPGILPASLLNASRSSPLPITSSPIIVMVIPSITSSKMASVCHLSMFLYKHLCTCIWFSLCLHVFCTWYIETLIQISIIHIFLLFSWSYCWF